MNLVLQICLIALFAGIVYTQNQKAMTYVVNRAMFNTGCWAESLAIDGHARFLDARAGPICTGVPCRRRTTLRFHPDTIVGLGEIYIQNNTCQPAMYAAHRSMKCLIKLDPVSIVGTVSFDDLPYSADHFKATVYVKNDSYYLIGVRLMPSRRLLLTEAKLPQIWFDVEEVVAPLQFDEYTKDQIRKSLSSSLAQRLKGFMYFYKIRLENEFRYLRARDDRIHGNNDSSLHSQNLGGHDNIGLGQSNGGNSTNRDMNRNSTGADNSPYRNNGGNQMRGPYEAGDAQPGRPLRPVRNPDQGNSNAAGGPLIPSGDQSYGNNPSAGEAQPAREPIDQNYPEGQAPLPPDGQPSMDSNMAAGKPLPPGGDTPPFNQGPPNNGAADSGVPPIFLSTPGSPDGLRPPSEDGGPPTGAVANTSSTPQSLLSSGTENSLTTSSVDRVNASAGPDTSSSSSRLSSTSPATGGTASSPGGSDVTTTSSRGFFNFGKSATTIAPSGTLRRRRRRAPDDGAAQPDSDYPEVDDPASETDVGAQQAPPPKGTRRTRRRSRRALGEHTKDRQRHE